MRTLPIAASVLAAFLVVLLGCGPKPERVSEMVLASMQEKFRTDSQLSTLGIEVVRVQVVKEGDNRFQGIATVKHEGDSHQVPVQITAEGDNVIWRTDSGAFAFVMQKAMRKIIEGK